MINPRWTTASDLWEGEECTLLKRPPMTSATPSSTGRSSLKTFFFWGVVFFFTCILVKQFHSDKCQNIVYNNLIHLLTLAYFLQSHLQAPLLGNHISYTVDVSNVGCHCNSAFYFVQMPGYDAGQVRRLPSKIPEKSFHHSNWPEKEK